MHDQYQAHVLSAYRQGFTPLPYMAFVVLVNRFQ
jgi:hypothetical protein